MSAAFSLSGSFFAICSDILNAAATSLSVSFVTDFIMSACPGISIRPSSFSARFFVF
jgi:hypothetical protein